MPDLFQSLPNPTPDLEQSLWNDPWLVMSTLQKAIRRSEIDIVHRAALGLYDLRGAGLWRRLIVIAFEDVGIGDPDALIDVTGIAVDAIRRKRPVAPAIIMRAARALADAPKDRSADYLMSLAALSPALEPVRERLGAMTVDERLGVVADGSQAIEYRATAAWYCSGLNIGGEKRLDSGDRTALMRLYIDLGAPEEMVNMSSTAATVTREAICVFLPLIWLISRNGEHGVEHPAIRLSPRIGGMPLYAMGMHTRSGRAAISAFAKAAPVREGVARWVPVYRARDVAFNAEFHVDGALTTPGLNWTEGKRIKRLAIETDLVHAGADPRGVDEVLAAFSDNIDLLNAIRSRLLTGAFGGKAY